MAMGPEGSERTMRVVHLELGPLPARSVSAWVEDALTSLQAVESSTAALPFAVPERMRDGWPRLSHLER